MHAFPETDLHGVAMEMLHYGDGLVQTNSNDPQHSWSANQRRLDTISANSEAEKAFTDSTDYRVEPHKYDPLSNLCQNDIKFGKSQNCIQIPFKACLKIHCQSDEIQNKPEQLVIVTMTKAFHNEFFFFSFSKWPSGMDEFFQGSTAVVSEWRSELCICVSILLADNPSESSR